MDLNRRSQEVFGVFKAYTTRVGSGPFPTELFDEDGQTLMEVGHEYGSTTGRVRRCGWLDLVALKYACQINGVTQLMMMKSDVLSAFEIIKVCYAYEYKGEIVNYLPFNIDDKHVVAKYKTFKGWKSDLTQLKDFSQIPKELSSYIHYLEEQLGLPIQIVSVGPDRKQTLFKT